MESWSFLDLSICIFNFCSSNSKFLTFKLRISLILKNPAKPSKTITINLNWATSFLSILSVSSIISSWVRKSLCLFTGTKSLLQPSPTLVTNLLLVGVGKPLKSWPHLIPWIASSIAPLVPRVFFKCVKYKLTCMAFAGMGEILFDFAQLTHLFQDEWYFLKDEGAIEFLMMKGNSFVRWRRLLGISLFAILSSHIFNEGKSEMWRKG